LNPKYEYRLRRDIPVTFQVTINICFTLMFRVVYQLGIFGWYSVGISW
jgi:hypothetical protein